ncbi:MAG: glycosyltransferase, partial [Pyrinomonadaceae bacterium]
AKLASLARRSRQYVESFHSLPAFAEQLRWLLRETASLPHAITARLVKSRGAMGWMARQLARNPALFETARRFYGRVPRNWLGGARMTYRRARLVLFWAPRLLRELVAQTVFLPAYWPIVKNGRSSASPTRSVVMLVISDARVDPRVERGARALAEAGFKVKVLYPDASPPRFAEKPIDWGPRISFRPLPARVAYFVLVFPWLFQRTILQAALEERPGFFHCHDLNTSLIGLAAARRVGARCVCDFHEWFSENVSLNLRRGQWRPHSKLHRAVLRRAEQLVMDQADEVITVCDSIANELSREFSGGNRKVQVVRNIPRAKASSKIYSSLRESLGARAEEFILLWQGGTGPTRMIEPIIEALEFAPKAVFVRRGQSLEAYGEGYRKLAKEKGVDQRLVLLDPVPSADVVAAAQGADAGIWTLPNLCKNFQYALPNKLFEYLAAGLPVLVADYPEARRIVEKYEVGLCFDPYDPKSIAAQLNALISDPIRATVFRSNTKRALTDLDPNREWAKLVTIYNELCEVAA